MSNKPWLSQYPSEIPAEIDVAPYQSVVELLDNAFASHASRPALTSMGRTSTFAELDLMSRRFAAWLQSQGAVKGDRIALMMPNLMPFAVCVLGALRAGCTVVTINPLYTPRELAHQVKDSGAETLVVFEAFAGTVAQALEGMELKRIVVVGTGGQAAALPGQIDFAQTLQMGAAATFTPVNVGPEDLAFLQYTGGTTGLSKGACLSHRNLVANTEQYKA